MAKVTVTTGYPKSSNAKVEKDPSSKKADWAKDDEAKAKLPDERKWKAEDALRDFQRVEEHKKDSQLMKDVDHVRGKRIRELAAIKVDVPLKTKRG